MTDQSHSADNHDLSSPPPAKTDIGIKTGQGSIHLLPPTDWQDARIMHQASMAKNAEFKETSLKVFFGKIKVGSPRVARYRELFSAFTLSTADLVKEKDRLDREVANLEETHGKKSAEYKAKKAEFESVCAEYKAKKDPVKKFKKGLPGVNVAGIFKPKRNNESFKKCSGIFLVDIDEIADPEAVKAQLKAIPSLAFAFISPSENGLKAGFRVHPFESDDEFKVIFKHIQLWLADTHGLEIDNSCKDISRLCFISHDPDIYINETPEILEFKQVDVVESNTSLKLDTPLNVEEITSALESLDAGMGYDGWLSVGMALHDAFDGSDTGSAIFEKWSATSWKYEHGEPDKKWNSFTSTSGSITIRTLFKMAIDSGWACSVGHDLVRRIEGKASKLQGFDIQALNIDPLTIDKIITSSFWDPKKSRYYSLTARNVLNMYSANDGLRFLEISSGSIFSKSYVYEWAEQTGLAEAKTKAIIKSFNDVVTEHLMFESQRTNIEMRVDMFADTPRIEMREELARVVYTHSLFVEGPWSAEVVADYKEHFPLLDEFLDFIIASRFARDRKKAYLWLKADSDWGKGFLMGVLNKLNMSVEISVKEVEKMFEGSPVGKSMVDFKRAFAIVVDEFKTVKSEIKQLQSEISLAPKNQLSFKVEVFAKVFFSAESVNSLVGEHGVEEQFINRFNHFNLKGTLDSRPLYRQVGSAKYIDSVTPYVANYLNKAIEEKRAVGKAKAEHDAEQYLIQFMDAHGIGNSYDSLTDGLGEFVRELAVYIKLNLYRDVRIIKEGEHTYL